MKLSTVQDLIQVKALNKKELRDCFSVLNKLIIGSDYEEARDYCHMLSDIILRNYPEVPEAPRPRVEEKPAPEEKATFISDQFKAHLFFKFSCYQENCFFCKNIIPARNKEHGLFTDVNMKHKWCEACASDEHKKNEYYVRERENNGK